jgi:hypothetical protein
MAAVAWKGLDRRPAWVMAVNAVSRAYSRAAALTEERAALAAAIRVIARDGGPSPIFLREVETREDEGQRFVETRTVHLRSDDELQLLNLYRRLRTLTDITCSDPRRALRPPDFAFGLLLIALLLGWAALEPPRIPDRRRWAQPAFVILNGLALGLLTASVVLVDRGWPGYLLHVSLVISFAPTIVWLVRVRVPWTARKALRLPYAALVGVTAIVSVAWVVRLASN